jgi:hypothetical protein
MKNIYKIIIVISIFNSYIMSGDYFPVKRPTPDVNANFQFARNNGIYAVNMGFEIRHYLKILNPPAAGHYEILSTIFYNSNLNKVNYAILLGRGFLLDFFTIHIGPIVSTDFKIIKGGLLVDFQIPTLLGSKFIPQYFKIGTKINSLKKENEFHFGLLYKFGFKSYQME